jgi:hypothetical protein
MLPNRWSRPVKALAHFPGGSPSRKGTLFLCLQVSTKPLFETHASQSHINAPGALQHLICRGIQRSQIFADDADRVYWDIVQKVLYKISSS